MEPITTTVIATLLAHWGGKAFDKAFETTTSEFTKGSINWLKSIFFKDNKPKEVLEKYEQKPDSSVRQAAIKAAIEMDLEDHPENKKYLMELVDEIEKKEINATTVNYSTITSGGHTIVGSNNKING